MHSNAPPRSDRSDRSGALLLTSAAGLLVGILAWRRFFPRSLPPSSSPSSSDIDDTLHDDRKHEFVPSKSPLKRKGGVAGDAGDGGMGGERRRRSRAGEGEGEGKSEGTKREGSSLPPPGRSTRAKQQQQQKRPGTIQGNGGSPTPVAAALPSMFVSFTKSSKGDRKRRATQSMAVQEWAAQYLHDADAGRFGDDPTLAVSEVKCLEVGCPPMETVVMLLDEKDPLNNKVRIMMGLMDVSEASVALAVGRFMRGEQEERHGCPPGCDCHPVACSHPLHPSRCGNVACQNLNVYAKESILSL